MVQNCCQVKIWDGAANLASAYKLGRAESGAAANLLNHIDDEIVERLTQMVKPLVRIQVHAAWSQLHSMVVKLLLFFVMQLP